MLSTKKSNLVPNVTTVEVITQPQIVTMMIHLCLVKKKQNSCKPSDVHFFTMITATVTRIAINGVQAEETITVETIIDPTPMTNTISKKIKRFYEISKINKRSCTFIELKNKLKTTTKNHQASIQILEAKFNRLADKQSARPSGSLPSNTQPNPKGNPLKPYQPPQAQNEHVNVVFTRSGKSYDPPTNPNDLQNDSQNPINFDSGDEDEESTLTPKPQTQKPIKETLIFKQYKSKFSYPQRLRKEKMEAQYGKFLDMIQAVRINIPLVDVLAEMPDYGKFLKDLVSNKHKLKQISSAFLNDESSGMIQNNVPPKLGDPRSFLIPCTFDKTFSCNALADLGASINLMPYSLYVKLSLKTLKPTKMSVRLADR
nr:reverse transcriptase domain-containing protein [Tanacetum cinerariifolium]